MKLRSSNCRCSSASAARSSPLLSASRSRRTESRALSIRVAPGRRDLDRPSAAPNRSATSAFLSRSKVEHAAPRRMPRGAAGKLNVDVILVRQVRPEHVENVDLGGRRRSRIRLALFVRTRAGARRDGSGRRSAAMRGTVVSAKQHRAVAGDQIAAVEALADEQRVVVGVIVVGGVELEEAPVVVARG